MLAEIAFSGATPTPAQIEASIRRLTVRREFIPIFMGSAFKNKGVQPLIDGIVKFLPSPLEAANYAYDMSEEGARITLSPDPRKPFVGLAFKLEESPFWTADVHAHLPGACCGAAT